MQNYANRPRTSASSLSHAIRIHTIELINLFSKMTVFVTCYVWFCSNWNWFSQKWNCVCSVWPNIISFKINLNAVEMVFKLIATIVKLLFHFRNTLLRVFWYRSGKFVNATMRKSNNKWIVDDDDDEHLSLIMWIRHCESFNQQLLQFNSKLMEKLLKSFLMYGNFVAGGNLRTAFY